MMKNDEQVARIIWESALLAVRQSSSTLSGKMPNVTFLVKLELVELVKLVGLVELVKFI